MKHYGDITKLSGAQVPAVDIVVGGSPCQDLSKAARDNRAGLSGERSGLFMEQIRVIEEMRNESSRRSVRGSGVNIRQPMPRYMVWENVRGCLSSNGGEDFRAVLESTARIAEPGADVPRSPHGGLWACSGVVMADRWSIAWRIHDAQFWGVAQRRERLALVADFGGQSAPEILFERESLSGNFSAVSAPQTVTPRQAEKSADQAGVLMTLQALGEYKEVGVASTLKQRDYKDATDLVLTDKGPRRLTPTEHERLQGFPDGWTDIGEWTDTKGKKHKPSDAPRYRALGNSIALPFWEWLAGRITDQLKKDGVINPTMASLFDGIGGFPLVFSRCGCQPVWASEIEEFPIAVSKYHFPE